MPISYLNSFKIINLNSLGCNCHLYSIDGIDENIEDYEKVLNYLRAEIAYDVKTAVVLTTYNNKDCIALPSNDLKIKNSYNVGLHHLKLNPMDSFNLDFNNLCNENIYLAREFLRNAYRSKFMFNRSNLWSDNFRSFFTKKSRNFYDDRRSVDIYQGFNYDVIITPLNEILIQIEIQHRYISIFYLNEILKSGREVDPSPTKPLHCLYEMCQNWYPIEITKILNKTVYEQTFEKEGEIYNVYDYTLNSANTFVKDEYKKKLKKEDTAIMYRNPGHKKGSSMYAASSLARKKYKTNELDNKNLHKLTQLSPSNRINFAQKYLESYFQNTFINNKLILLDKKPFEAEIKIFPIPDIRYGDNKILHVRRGAEQGISLKEFGKQRLKFALNYGVLEKKPLRETYLLYPDSLNDKLDIVNKIKQTVEILTSKLIKNEFVLKLKEFKVKNEYKLREQLRSIDKVIQNGDLHGSMLIILPLNARKSLHNMIKKNYHKNLMIQCITEEKLISFFSQNINSSGEKIFEIKSEQNGKFISYVRNIVFGILQVQRRWLSCLESHLNYDAYIGIDVLNGFVGFSFLYKNSSICHFKPVEMPTSQQSYKERINNKLLFDEIANQLLSDIEQYNLNIRSIIFCRDGQTFRSEIKSFKKIVKDVLKISSYGIVEIHKSSVTKLRLFRKINSNDYTNPVLGSYLIYGHKMNNSIISTTGYPFDKHLDNRSGYEGTSLPLHIKLVEGNLNLEKISQDIFSLSILCWSAPDKSSRLPNIIKLADEFLEPIASKIDETEDFEEEFYEEEIINLN